MSSIITNTVLALPMAPNPSERIGRRLSELLEQPQDPFLLKIYLLEKGCSGRIIGSQRSSFCWPSRAGNRLRKPGSPGGIRNSSAAGLITCFFFKIAYSKFIFKKAVRWCGRTPTNNRSSIFDFFSQDPRNRLSHAPAESSVFDNPYEYGLRESYVPLNETPEDKSSNRSRFLSDFWREAEERIWSYHCFLDGGGKLEGATHVDMIPSGFGEEWQELEPEVTNIGLCLEAAIFADLQEEAIFDMLTFCIIK